MNVKLDLPPDLEGVGRITPVHIDDGSRLTAYGVVEERLANAHTHGHAGEVADDGIGVSEDMGPTAVPPLKGGALAGAEDRLDRSCR